jgi:hypothetical protein
MKKRLFFFLILVTFSATLKSQTIKTDVLVIGNGSAAIAAGLQSAISGVKTTVLLQAGGFDINPITNDISSGLQADFLGRIKEKDSTATRSFTKNMANEVLKKWTDSTKNLTIIRDILWVKAARAGNNWSFKLSNNATLKAKVLVNVANGKINDALKITAPKKNWIKLDYVTTIYRTSIASGKFTEKTHGNVFSMYDLFIPLQENLVWISNVDNMLVGQAAGATAAYAAFFKSKTSLANLKTIQGELLNYKLNLMPFEDIKNDDLNWKAIQMVGLTGVLKGDVNTDKVLFAPEKNVRVSEITQPLKEFFYKAQIWFDDHKDTTMTLSSALDLLCYVGNKAPESTKKEVEKKWKTTYKFTSDFDLAKSINRREFAVLLQDYLPPFNVNVDNKGKVVR